MVEHQLLDRQKALEEPKEWPNKAEVVEKLTEAEVVEKNLTKA